MSRMIFVNLPVSDLNASMAFLPSHWLREQPAFYR